MDIIKYAHKTYYIAIDQIVYMTIVTGPDKSYWEVTITFSGAKDLVFSFPTEQEAVQLANEINKYI
jgi:hypothetical protein